jgi:hypothetical protein
MPAAERSTEPLDYRPLSLTALASLVLAGAFAVVVLVCAAVAYRQGKPLDLGVFGLTPWISGGLALLGWWQVQRSEGTRAGAKLAVWGGLLSVLVGLPYGAYRSAVNLALRQQATTFTLQWFDKLKAGDMYGAFYDTLLPAERQIFDPSRPDRIEERFGASENPGRVPLRRFETSELIRLVVNGGQDTQVEPRGVTRSEYSEGSYWVERAFDVRTPEGSFEAVITLNGMESPRDFKGRQWYLRFDFSGIPHKEKAMMTALGDERNRLRASAYQFASNWARELRAGHFDAVVLDTAPPAVRREYDARLAATQLAATAGDPLGSLALAEAARQQLLEPRRRAFLDGALVSLEHFKTSPPADLVQEIKRRLLPDSVEPIQFTLDQQIFPVTEVNGRIRVGLDLQLMLPPRYSADGQLVVEAEAGAARDPDLSVWRVAALELHRARAITDPNDPRSMMRGRR